MSEELSLEDKDRLLTRIACADLMEHILDSFGGSTIYAVTRGWQITHLISRQEMVEAASALTFEHAVHDAAIGTIFVPQSATITREIAGRILLESGQVKTIFWEV